MAEQQAKDDAKKAKNEAAKKKTEEKKKKKKKQYANQSLRCCARGGSAPAGFDLSRELALAPTLIRKTYLAHCCFA